MCYVRGESGGSLCGSSSEGFGHRGDFVGDAEWGEEGVWDGGRRGVGSTRCEYGGC